MKMFNMIGIGERAGSGVPDIFAVWEAQGWKQPVVEETFGVDRTTLTLPLVGEKKSGGKRVPVKKQTPKANDKKQTIKTNDKKQTIKTQAHIEKIVAYLKKAGEARTADVAEAIGLSPDRTRVILANLEVVEALGSNRNRTYRLR